MRILLLGPASSVHIMRWAGDLTAAGHQVLTASWQPGPSATGAEPWIAPDAGGWPARRAARAARWLRRLIREFRPEIIHVHSLGTYGLLALAIPSTTCPIVMTPWGSELRSGRGSPARAAVIRLALRRADLVLPTSAEVASEVMTRYRVPEARIAVLSWGVPEKLFARRGAAWRATVRGQLGVPWSATVVLSVRSASGTYRIREIVSAFAVAAGTRSDLYLVVLAGHRSDRAAARRARESYLDELRAAAAGLAGRMVLIDRVLSQEQSFDVMCASDLAVSIPHGDQRSSSVLEAALAGCRLLLSDIPPYQELVGEGLAADLLREPVTDSLAEALRAARPVESPVVAGTVVANQDFISKRERGSAKIADLERHYRRLVTMPGA